MSEDTTKPEDAKVEETTAPVTEVATEAAPEVKEETKIEEVTAEETTAEEVVEEEVAPTPSPALAYKEKISGMDDIKAGQTVRLHERIQDVSPKGEVRERIQVFEGIILALGGSGISRTITLQKTSNGVGVEKIYPINSPVVSKIELIKTAKVRQAKLGYLKNLKKRFKRKLKEDYTELGVQKKKKGRR